MTTIATIPESRQRETGTAEDPLDEATVREHLRLAPDQDALILPRYIAASLAVVERYTARPVLDRTWRGETLKLEGFPDELVVCYVETPTVEAVKYTNTADTEISVPLPDFAIKYDPRSRMLTLEHTGAEISDFQADSVVVVEYSTKLRDPESLLEARLMLIGHYYEHAEAVIDGANAVEVPLGARALMDLHADQSL